MYEEIRLINTTPLPTKPGAPTKPRNMSGRTYTVWGVQGTAVDRADEHLQWPVKVSIQKENSYSSALSRPENSKEDDFHREVE